jgi:GNAT superfamily N-acetyltransferase
MRTAEIKRIWTHPALRQQGLAAKVVQELERRAVLAGYSHIYLTTGFRQPEAVRLYLSQGYEAQFDLTATRKSTASRRLMVDCASPKRWR